MGILYRRPRRSAARIVFPYSRRRPLASGSTGQPCPPDRYTQVISRPFHTRLVYLIYRLLQILAAPLVTVYFLNRARRDRRYLRHFRERLGNLRFSPEPSPARSIWLHSVSVGEVISAIALIGAIRKTYPNAPVFVSCSTLAGREIAEEKLRPLVDGLFYAPIDYAFAVRRVLRKLRPALVVVMETEIWPNLYREVKRSGAALAIVNGRISDRAFPRYRRYRAVFAPVLSCPDLLLVQSEEDRRRYIAAGAPPERVEAAGNLKYDFNPGEGEIPDAIARFLEKLRPRAIWIAASTMPPRDASDVDEDDIVIAEYQKLAGRYDDLLLILVPRRPERFLSAAAKLDAAGIAYVRRSALADTAVPSLPCVLLLDSMGELSRLFAIATVVFMGGTLPRRGGHNILEPAYFGKAVIAGPHMENFTAIAAEFTEAGALVRISQPEELATAVAYLLDNSAAREEIGRKARALAASKRGVTYRFADRLLQLYFENTVPKHGSALLAPLAALWEFGAAWKRRRALSSARKLDRPVISVGGISMGGTGKTPFTDWLATELRSGGAQPAILTRGYRRRSTEHCIILPAGHSAPADLTGDEPQIYLRHGAAHLGIGMDRYECGLMIEGLETVDVFLLDDGFQHWKLTRDIDIVLIDALDPFGGGYVFPRGRLREPLDQLARASAFVITRVESGLRADAIERELRRWNPAAPVFRSRVVARGWREPATGRTFNQAPFESAGAFCGLANPGTFWRSLEALDIKVKFRWAFGDHHHYRPQEVKRVARRARQQGAQALVTTEKDAANLCAGCLRTVAPLPVYTLEIGIEFENREAFLEFLWSGLRSARS
jgi:3-deoxy-D-manno-octulosonic-acid transferase